MYIDIPIDIHVKIGYDIRMIQHDISVGFLTRKEVARLYGCSPRSVNALWQSGHIPAPIPHQFGKQRIWSKSVVMTDLANKNIAPQEVA
tara:strand:- start:367 stop:633 length:267 start_codon:yes stop_codon:yes gene_type:complete